MAPGEVTLSPEQLHGDPEHGHRHAAGAYTDDEATHRGVQELRDADEEHHARHHEGGAGHRRDVGESVDRERGVCEGSREVWRALEARDYGEHAAFPVRSEK
jgi:hypothetical protein